MNKKPLIGICICAVVLLVLVSLTNVVGYQTVQTSQQNLIKGRINQRELLFQTIVDIANNKEIQRVILKSQMSRGIFPTSDIPVVTQNQLKMMYFIGLILSKVISSSRIQSISEKYQLNNLKIQKEINGVIEKDATVKAEITQLQTSECDCEENEKTKPSTPIICAILFIIFLAICIPYEFLTILFQIFYTSILRILLMPWMILLEIMTGSIFFLLALFECWYIPPPDVRNVMVTGE